jgi:ubiquinone/menaquinone biosynthesis C-methylase UbiE/uncharacterized protein YbaR (Trm112 family)
MQVSTAAEIRKILYARYGREVGLRRRLQIQLANGLNALGSTSALRGLRDLYGRLVSVLKVEDQVLKSYDRMAGVYNRENERLQTDETVVFCKFDRQFAHLPARDIYRAQQEYLAEAVFKPILQGGMRVLEVGAGESTTIHNLMKALAPLSVHWSALELSWSRTAEGKRWAIEHGTFDRFDSFVAASAVDIPFPDNSFDVVYTNGCLEQIRYATDRALTEILRVAKRWVILYEPSYELGDQYQKLYIEGSQYCRGLPTILERLGVKPIRYELAPHSFNPFCCYAVTVIDKGASSPPEKADHCCPSCKKPLLPIKEGYFCTTLECSCVYPVIWGVPCLRKEDAIFASMYREITASSSRSTT